MDWRERQLRMQLRMARNGRCPICGKPARRVTCGSRECVHMFILGRDRIAALTEAGQASINLSDEGEQQ